MLFRMPFSMNQGDEGATWLLGLEFDSPAFDFWKIENPPAIGGASSFVAYCNTHVPLLLR